MRNFIFKFVFFFGLIIILLLFLPTLLLSNKYVLFGGKLLGKWAAICLKIFFSTKINVKGLENLDGIGKYFIACSHQSMFETFYLQTIFNSPIFILKTELLNIPVFGWYLKKINSISISRNKITKENFGLIDKIKKTMNDTNRPLIIFPQGTRTSSEDRSPFKKGVSKIYSQLNIKCLPVAINSGSVWPKSGSMKNNKSITISILKPIEPGIDQKNFLETIEKVIYSELDHIH